MHKIGLLICGHVRKEITDKHGEYGDFFKRFLADDDFTFVDYFVVDGVFPEKVDECDAYVVTGSAHGAYEDHAYISPLENFIRAAYAKEIPQVGICFGHQILAQALGGRVEKYDGGWGLGVHNYSMSLEELGDNTKTLKLNAVHQDQVVEKPRDAEVIASSEFCQNAGLLYGKKAISFQPHPEFDADFMRDLIELRKGKSFSENIADDALESLAQPVGNNKISKMIKGFIKRVEL
ncbi:MAG: type 1 glutamine amidotransferase [Hyphomicrobiales bacterium]